MDNNKELNGIQENYERVKQALAQKDYFLNTKNQILEWAKDYHGNEKNKYYYSYFFFFVKSHIIEQKLSRLQALAMTGLITAMLEDGGYMHDEIDNYISNTLFSLIYEEGSWNYSIPFSDDPPGDDPKHYAWSGKWKLWQGS